MSPPRDAVHQLELTQSPLRETVRRMKSEHFFCTVMIKSFAKNHRKRLLLILVLALKTLKIKMKKRLIIGIFTITILSSCSSEKFTPVKDVIVHGTKGNLWELELKVNRSGQGWSIHNFSHDVYNVEETYWMYVDSITGRVPGKRVAVSVLQDSYDFQENNEGYVEFDSLTMTINLKTGANTDRLNGTYLLKFEKK